MSGVVYLVGAGPGDAGLITVRGVECLKIADVVLADRLVAQALVDRYVLRTAEVIVRPARREGLDQDEINRVLVERARAGQTVVRLKGGDPFIFGRGGEEAEALAAAGIPFEVVPGVSAAIAVPAYAGIPLTHRGAAGAVAFATGHEADDKDGGAVDWHALARSSTTLVLFMGVSHLDAVMQRLLDAGAAPATKVAVIERGTTPRQKTVVGTIADIAARAAQVKPPALVVVGDVVGVRDRLAWFEQRPLHGRAILLLATRADGELLPRGDGAEVIQVSPLSVMPRFAETKAALARLEEMRLVAVTSANAVDALVGALKASGHDVRALYGKVLAAVGEASARRLSYYNLSADLTSDGGGAHLAAEIARAQLSGPVLVLRAKGGREELPATLRAAGYAVEVVDAYDTIPDERALAAAAARHRVTPFDAIGFASPKGARAFLEAVGGLSALAGVKIGAVGETTRAALVEAGLEVQVLSPRPDLAALLDALAAALKAG